jgi:N6-adenosine-specific RNA methylase IME4
MTGMASKHKIADITIGKRHRKDVGDIALLAASIANIGLLHPIPIRPDGTLIAGERRLRACKSLGWTEIPVNVVSLDDIVRGEFAENAHRKDFLPSEIDAIRRAIEPIERKAAQERQREHGRTAPGKHSAKISHSNKRKPERAADKIGAFAGVSGRTVEKIATVVEAIEKEPERFGHLKEELDRHRGVDRAYRALSRARDEQRVLSLVPQPGRYRTLVIDAPWPAEIDYAGRGNPQYSLMTREQILALPVASWAEADCHLYLWVTNMNLPLAVECMAAWGFTHKSVLTWVKPRFGLGVFFRGSTEHCLFGVRGKLMTRSTSIATHFEAPVGEHSEKPDRFYEIVREASYLPAGEAFQRKPRDGFVNLFAASDGPTATVQNPGRQPEQK